MSELAAVQDEVVLAEIIEDQDSQAQLTPEEAQVLTGQIRQTIDVATGLMIVAYRRRAWTALGYASWDTYCDAEFGALQIKLPKEQRLAQILQLRTEGGMSVRAIAAATGLGIGTIHRSMEENQAVRSSTVPNGTVDDLTVDPVTIQGVNGKTYASSAPEKPRYDDLPPEWAPVDNRPEKVAAPYIDVALTPELASLSPADAGLAMFTTLEDPTPRKAMTVDDLLGRLTRKSTKASVITEVFSLCGQLVEARLQTGTDLSMLVDGEQSNPRVDAFEDLVALVLLLSSVLEIFEAKEIDSDLRQIWTAQLQDAADNLGGVLDGLN